MSSPAPPPPPAKAEAPTFLFTPGAWHSPPVFDLVRADLKSRGFPSAAVKLVSVNPTDPKTQGAAEDAAAVRGEIEKLVNDGKEVIVVCHSYGGVPTAMGVEGYNLKDRVAKGEKGGVKMVIYLTSFAIPAGASLSSGLGGEKPDWWNITGDLIIPTRPIEVFYADVPTPLAEQAVAAILPMSSRSISDASTFTPWTQGFTMGYIFAEDDQAIPLAVQQGMAAQFPEGSWTASLKSSHSPFLSMPERLGQVLEEAAGTL
ncbi:alpha/beta-hydrolase [Periconia macrospinosa]|uniref:Alpha/beta-hydrolase n=1 Tax=Periconia macrospinosa TaxID=97972 RepID=A0A2V1DD51_9PLEO|nr:alpha/beta-hydrolase [Periconia macrospinosa]